MQVERQQRLNIGSLATVVFLFVFSESSLLQGKRKRRQDRKTAKADCNLQQGR